METAITEFLSGEPISEIAAGLYRSSGFVKAIIERVGVPQKGDGRYDYLPEECVGDTFKEEEIVWSARYHSPAQIRKEVTNIDYEKKYESKCYDIWVLEKTENEFSIQGGFRASQLAYDLGKLTHLEKYGVDLSRI